MFPLFLTLISLFFKERSTLKILDFSCCKNSKAKQKLKKRNEKIQDQVNGFDFYLDVTDLTLNPNLSKVENEKSSGGGGVNNSGMKENLGRIPSVQQSLERICYCPLDKRGAAAATL